MFKNRTTDDLKQELMSDADIDAYIKENRHNFVNCDISRLLRMLYEDRQISKAELARRSGMSEVYLHQLFSGRRKPSRDKPLCPCVGMALTMFPQLYGPLMSMGLCCVTEETVMWTMDKLAADIGADPDELVAALNSLIK